MSDNPWNNREIDEIAHSLIYEGPLAHFGTGGHNAYSLIAKLAVLAGYSVRIDGNSIALTFHDRVIKRYLFEPPKEN